MHVIGLVLLHDRCWPRTVLIRLPVRRQHERAKKRHVSIIYWWYSFVLAEATRRVMNTNKVNGMGKIPRNQSHVRVIVLLVDVAKGDRQQIAQHLQNIRPTNTIRILSMSQLHLLSRLYELFSNRSARRDLLVVSPHVSVQLSLLHFLVKVSGQNNRKLAVVVPTTSSLTTAIAIHLQINVHVMCTVERSLCTTHQKLLVLDQQQSRLPTQNDHRKVQIHQATLNC